MKLEQEQARLHEELARPEVAADAIKLRTASERLARIAEELETANQEWARFA